MQGDKESSGMLQSSVAEDVRNTKFNTFSEHISRKGGTK
jgi:hypothetical protein